MVNGIWELHAGELTPITVSAARPIPHWPGTYIKSSGKHYWNEGVNWHEYDPSGQEGEWEPTEDPTIQVLVGGDLSTGNFISKDTGHHVHAECEIDIIKWEGEDLASSGSITFSNDSNSPTVTLHPSSSFAGRTYALEYQVTGRVGNVSDTKTFKQNKLSMLRQEYVDMDKNHTPDIGDFDTLQPAYPNLLLASDYHHNLHEHRILDFINGKARELKLKYTLFFVFTAGYACPGDNGHRLNSQHIYGKAYDFDAGYNTEANSKKNWDIYWVGKNQMSATWAALYDDNNTFFTNIPDTYTDPKPSGFVGDHYRHGQHDWR